MTSLHALIDNALLQNLGWTLVHSIWQLALVALALAVVLALLGDSSARARYCASCLALLAMLALPATTFLFAGTPDALPASLRRAGASNVVQLAHANSAAGDARAGVMSHARAGELFDEENDGKPLRRWAVERVASLLPWLALAWATCVAALLARLAGGWLLNRRVRRAAGAAQTLLGCQVALARLRGRLKVSRAVRLCRSAAVEVPTVIGWLRPVILVPACALAGLTHAQLEAVIAHELAHIRRHDYLLNLIQSFIETLLFYHPAVWWVSRRVRAAREHICDDLAVEATGDVLVYARALTALEQLRRQPTPISRLALAADGGSLMQRIQRLIKVQTASPSSTTSTSTRAPLALAFVAALALASALVGAHGAGVAAGQAKRAADRGQAKSAGAQRRVAVTFVALPMVQTYDQRRAERDMRKLLASLSANDVRAIGFVNAAQLYRDGAVNEWRVGLLRAWLDAGMELGSEGFAHPNLYDTPLDTYERDVLHGEELTGQLARERGARLRYFSYPYLNVGASRETKDAFEKFLAARDMKVHKVTIDNLDWLFGKAYADARRDDDQERMRRIADEYVPYMERVFDFYEQLSRDTLGYEPPQVLMLTANALNCAKFDDLAAMMRRRGYQFVSLDEAMADRAYQQPDTYTGAWGISWLQRWAMAKGLEFRDEPYLSPYMEQFDTYTKKWQGIKVEQKK
jgi:beta-lactamase regulating signal transducer with metallopeptidase domain